MEQLRTLVLRLANAERVGGRAQILDGHTLILNDCMHWGCVSTEVVLSHFPEVQISVRACQQSLSGFSVVFYRGTSSHRELVWYLLIGLGMASCAYVLLASLHWWSAGIRGI